MLCGRVSKHKHGYTGGMCPYVHVPAVLFSYITAATESVSVTTNVGTFNGYAREFEVFGERRRVEIYLGIPYATSPTGERRFEKRN